MLQKEQAAVEYVFTELALGKKVKNLPKSAFQRREQQIYNILARYEEYAENKLQYLKTIGYYL